MTQPERINLEQRSPEWALWRKGLGMASEAAAMLGISPWFPQSPADLYAVKSGAAGVYVSPAMRQGVALESVALASLAYAVQIEFLPACFQRGRLGASLDGIDMYGLAIAEVKAPAKGSESPLYQAAMAGTIADHYMAQIQQQLWCSGAEIAWFGVYAHDTGQVAYVEVHPDPEWTSRLIDGWGDYFLNAGLGVLATPQRDERTDAAWLMAAQSYRDAKRASDLYAALADDAKRRLDELAEGRSCAGGGIKYTASTRKGSIDYPAALAVLAPGADLEEWRKEGGSITRITVEDSE